MYRTTGFHPVKSDRLQACLPLHTVFVKPFHGFRMHEVFFIKLQLLAICLKFKNPVTCVKEPDWFGIIENKVTNICQHMEKWIAFTVLSVPVIYFSWRTLFNVKSHGFYRFFSWECIIWLLVSNYSFWFDNPLSVNQIFSWIFLSVSLYLIIAGVILIKKVGKPGNNRAEKNLYNFENTTELVDNGIFYYIRHPLYSSLLFLTWGIFFKKTTEILLLVSTLSSLFLYLTARFDENECIRYFGHKYERYMKRSKMFIPFVF